MAEQKKWTNQKLKDEFISSSKFGLGAYKLYMSLMPDKVLNMLEWCGFSNISESEGLRLLDESGSGKDFFAIMAQMTPLNYFYIFQTQFGVLGERKTRSLEKVHEIHTIDEIFDVGHIDKVYENAWLYRCSNSVVL